MGTPMTLTVAGRGQGRSVSLPTWHRPSSVSVPVDSSPWLLFGAAVLVDSAVSTTTMLGRTILCTGVAVLDDKGGYGVNRGPVIFDRAGHPQVRLP